MRDQMKNGQLAFFYHSNCKIPGIAAVVEVTITSNVVDVLLIFNLYFKGNLGY